MNDRTSTLGIRGAQAHRALAPVLLCLALAPLPASAATLFSDDFEDGSLAPWSVVQGAASDAGVNTDTSQSGSQSMFLRFDTVTVASPVIDTSGSNATLDLWIRRGDNGFSNYPENGEDLEVYYLDNGGIPVLLETFPGGGTAGEILTPSYNLPANARHANFQVQLRLVNSNGFDYWHVDDVTVTQSSPAFIGTGTGLTGAYCNRDTSNETVPCDSSPDTTRIDATVDFNNGDAGWPAPGIGGDTFSVRWTGQIQAQFTEDYRLHTISDDGIRVWIDGNLVIDNYTDHGPTEDISSQISLNRAQKYDIVIEYYENGGGQDARLLWSSPSTAPQSNPVVVPQTQLYPTGGVGANLLADWRMDESSWSGTSGEVADSSGNGRDGTAQGGAATAGATPAIAGDPGTCRYGTFDGNDDHVTVGGLSGILNGTATLTFWIRTTQVGSDTGWQAPGVTGVEEGGGSDDIFWGWIDASGRIGVSVANDYAADQKSSSSINDGVWHHVALTRDAGSGATRVYVDGTLETSGTSGTGTIGNAFSSIGRIEDTGGSPEYFQGDLDEVRVYDAVLDTSDVQAIRDATHPCTTGGGVCVADFAVYGDNQLGVGSQVQVNGNIVAGSGNAIDPDTAQRSDTTLPLPTFEPAGFPSFGGPNFNPANGATIVADDYGDIRVRGNRTVNFDTSNGNDFRIDELRVDNDATINLQPGRYFIDTLDLRNDTQLNVVGSGTVEIFIDQQYRTRRRSDINVGGGPGGLLIRLYDGASAQLDDDGEFVGTVYAPGAGSNIDVGDDVTINGGLFAGGDVSIGDDVSLTYGSAAEAAGRLVAQCDPVGVDHYAITHDGSAVTCGEEAVTITAHDSSDGVINPGNVTISLATSTAKGTWARLLTGSGTFSPGAAGSGTASYTFPGNGETGVTLAFNYTSVAVATDPETVNFDVDGGTEGAGEDPDLVVARSGFRLTDGSGNPLNVPGQIAGKPSDTAPGAVTLALQAVRASDSDPAVCEPYFPSGTDVDVELGGECGNPSACAGRSLAVTNNGNTTALATSDDNAGLGAAGYTPVTLRFGANAEAPLVLQYDDAGAIQLHARYNPIDDGTGTPPVVNYVIGASNPYVVRPFGFDVSVAGDDNTTGAGGTVLAVAGDDVDTTVRAVVWQSGDDSDNDGAPDSGADLSDNTATPNFGNEAAPETVTLAPTVAAPVGGSDGTLSSATFSSFSGGSETHGVSWDEVGHVHLDAALTDGNYLGGSDASGRADRVGRFIPADFLVAVADDGDMEVGCNATFTYTGQPFGYATNMEPVLTITARNRAGGTTTNYRGTYAKMSAADVTVDPPTADSAQLGRDGLTNVAITATVNTGALVANGDGTLTYTLDSGDGFAYDKVDNARIDPFTPAFDLDVSAVDDGEASAATPLPTAQPAATHDIRFGRLAVDGAIGSELAPIDQAVRAEYWLNETWQTHADDACTTLALASELQLDNDQGGPVNGTQPLPVGGGSTDLTTNTADPVTLAAGRADLSFAATGDGNTGFVETTLSLLANRPWLRHDWDDADGAGDGPYDDLPAGRVTFGIHSGSPNWIHFRRTQ